MQETEGATLKTPNGNLYLLRTIH